MGKCWAGWGIGGRFVARVVRAAAGTRRPRQGGDGGVISWCPRGLLATGRAGKIPFRGWRSRKSVNNNDRRAKTQPSRTRSVCLAWTCSQVCKKTSPKGKGGPERGKLQKKTGERARKGGASRRGESQQAWAAWRSALPASLYGSILYHGAAPCSAAGEAIPVPIEWALKKNRVWCGFRAMQ